MVVHAPIERSPGTPRARQPHPDGELQKRQGPAGGHVPRSAHSPSRCRGLHIGAVRAADDRLPYSALRSWLRLEVSPGRPSAMSCRYAIAISWGRRASASERRAASCCLCSWLNRLSRAWSSGMSHMAASALAAWRAREMPLLSAATTTRAFLSTRAELPRWLRISSAVARPAASTAVSALRRGFPA